MKRQPHQHIALFLAFLVLLSTTGFSIQRLLCDCTGNHYLSLFSMQEMDCCEKKAEQVKPVEASCCSKAKKCETEKAKKQKSFHKKCCSGDSQYYNLDKGIEQNEVFDITLEVSAQLKLTPQPNLSIPAKTWFYTAPQAQQPNNKAPPLAFGRTLLNWTQVYRC